MDILDGVGSTEMLHIYLSNRAGNVEYGTCGFPVPGYEVRIVDDDLNPADKGESGEMLVRGPTSALFYWNNRERTASTFLGDWLRTGDKFHQREDGRFVYEGRCDDMLKVGGLYVSPFEVESALIGHAAVLEAAVIGRQDADGLVKPCAYVVLKSGTQATAKDLQEHVKSLLAPYKYPRWVNICDDLPKTPTGKLQRFRLRAMT
jgi:benzoate-CoA ligase